MARQVGISTCGLVVDEVLSVISLTSSLALSMRHLKLAIWWLGVLLSA
jgi:hypothetical protein